eukprot:9452837-Ditylum_brightwellii.AAC.1
MKIVRQTIRDAIVDALDMLAISNELDIGGMKGTVIQRVMMSAKNSRKFIVKMSNIQSGSSNLHVMP